MVEGVLLGRPQPIGTITVEDYRFKYSDPKNALAGLRYKISDGKWKEADDPNLQKGFAAMRTHSPRYSSVATRKIKQIVLCLIIATSLLPIILWLMRRRRKTRRR